MFTSSTRRFSRVKLLVYSSFTSKTDINVFLILRKWIWLTSPGHRTLSPSSARAATCISNPSLSSVTALWLWGIGEGTQWPRIAWTPGNVECCRQKKTNSLHEKQQLSTEPFLPTYKIINLKVFSIHKALCDSMYWATFTSSFQKTLGGTLGMERKRRGSKREATETHFSMGGRLQCFTAHQENL